MSGQRCCLVMCGKYSVVQMGIMAWCLGKCCPICRLQTSPNSHTSNESVLTEDEVKFGVIDGFVFTLSIQQWSMINTQEETHLFKNKFCYLVVQIKIVLSIENDNLFLYFTHEVHFTDYALSCMKGCSKHSLREILLTGSRTWILSRKSLNWDTFLIWSSGNLLPPENISYLI